MVILVYYHRLKKKIHKQNTIENISKFALYSVLIIYELKK